MIDLASTFQSAVSYHAFIPTAQANQFKNSYDAICLDQTCRTIFSQLPFALKIMVIAEPWCGDVIALVPVIFKVTENLQNVELKIISRDQNPDLMETYLSKGKKSVPKVIFLNQKYQEIAVWGPRPTTAMSFYNDNSLLMKTGLLGKGIIFNKVKKFYKENQGKEMQTELAALLQAHG